METSRGAHHDEPSLIDEIRKALESGDFEAYANLYAEDAILEEVSSSSPPAHPAIARGRGAILKRMQDEILRDPLSGWARQIQSSTILDAIETVDAIAFTEMRTYVAGDKVIAQHLAHKRGGKIDRDRLVVAWDPE